MPSLSSFFPTANPEKPRSTMNAVIPLYPADGFAFAKITNTPASAPLVIHNFCPFRIQRSPFFSARADNPNASDPDPDSDNAYAPTVSEVSIGRYFDFCSVEPYRFTG